MQKIADILPHCSSADLPVVTFSVEGQDGKNNNFRVRRKVVLDALLWLKRNNSLYESITIDMSCINSLPADDIIEIHNVIVEETEECATDTGPVQNKILQEEVETSSFLPSSHPYRTH